MSGEESLRVAMYSSGVCALQCSLVGSSSSSSSTTNSGHKRSSSCRCCSTTQNSGVSFSSMIHPFAEAAIDVSTQTTKEKDPLTAAETCSTPTIAVTLRNPRAFGELINDGLAQRRDRLLSDGRGATPTRSSPMHASQHQDKLWPSIICCMYT